MTDLISKDEVVKILKSIGENGGIKVGSNGAASVTTTGTNGQGINHSDYVVNALGASSGNGHTAPGDNNKWVHEVGKLTAEDQALLSANIAAALKDPQQFTNQVNRNMISRMESAVHDATFDPKHYPDADKMRATLQHMIKDEGRVEARTHTQPKAGTPGVALDGFEIIK